MPRSRIAWCSRRRPQDDAHAHRAAADEGLDALLKAMPPGDERTADVRWLLEWRVERAKPEDRGRALTAWALVEETELGDPARALVLYKKVIDAEPEDFEALAAVSRLSLAQGDVEGALAALIARRGATEGEARNALDVQIATILASRPGRGREALDRVAGVLEAAPHDPAGARARRQAPARSRGHGARRRGAREVARRRRRSRDARRHPAAPHRRTASPARTCASASTSACSTCSPSSSKTAEAYEVVVRAAKELPRHAVLWDRAETLARQLSQPDPVAALYEEVLRQDLPKSEAIELGQRAVAFYEEWFEDGVRVVGILERLLEIEPDDTWAFDRLKLIFDAQERWDDLFALYDRAAASADKERRLELLEEAAQIAKDFANHSKRAIGYLEQLLELKPGNTRLSAALERLYERHGCHRELIGLLGNRLPQLSHRRRAA